MTDRKQRLTEMRKAGHAWAEREVYRIRCLVGGEPNLIDELAMKSCDERLAALAALGASQEERDAWERCFCKRFCQAMRWPVE